MSCSNLLSSPVPKPVTTTKPKDKTNSGSLTKQGCKNYLRYKNKILMFTDSYFSTMDKTMDLLWTYLLWTKQDMITIFIIQL